MRTETLVCELVSWVIPFQTKKSLCFEKAFVMTCEFMQRFLQRLKKSLLDIHPCGEKIKLHEICPSLRPDVVRILCPTVLAS